MRELIPLATLAPGEHETAAVRSPFNGDLLAERAQLFFVAFGFQGNQIIEKPVIILLGGTTGAGKTSLALEVARRLGIGVEVAHKDLGSGHRATIAPRWPLRSGAAPTGRPRPRSKRSSPKPHV